MGSILKGKSITINKPMEYIIIKRGAQLYICRQGVEAKQKGIYFINGEKGLI